MKTMRQDTVRTRASLLTAATEVFAEKGYRDATIAEISQRAGANLAAINYHFGDKDTLYKEAWRHAFSESIKAHPPDGGVDAGAPPNERLKGHVSAFLRRITRSDAREFLIGLKELATPTGLLEEVMREELRPLRRRVAALVREIIGPRISDAQARFCVASIIGQCLIPAFINIAEAPARNVKDESLRIDDIEAYVEHVVLFSLAGMRAIRGRTRSSAPVVAVPGRHGGPRTMDRSGRSR